jgi:HK97 family phage portal protein
MQVAQTRDGEIYYKWLGAYDYDRQQIKAQVFDSSEIYHIMATTFDGVIGYSPIYALKETIGTGMAAEKYSGSFFANGSRPSGVLQHAGRLDADAAERLRTSWNALYQGTSTGNAARTAILEDGLEWKPISLPPDEAQFLETMKASTEQICAAFRVPTHFLGNREGLSQYNSLEAQASEFSRYTLTPWLTKWELEAEKKLLKTNDRREIKFDLASLLRSDHKTRFDIYRVGREIGVYSINEIRKLESLPPIDNGDEHIMPMNYEDIEKEEPVEELMSARNILTPMFEDSYNRLSKVLVNEVTKQITKNKDKKENRALSSGWVEKFFNERFEGIIKDTLTPLSECTSRCVNLAKEDVYYYISHGFFNMRSSVLSLIMEKDLENVSKLTSETNTRAIDDLAELIRKGKNV